MRVNSIYVKKIFYIVLIISLLLFFFSIPATHFFSLKLYLWKEGSSFYDFFTCLKGNIYWNRYELYSDGTIYPPLANLIYAVFTRCMSIETLEKLESFSNYNDIKGLQECGLFFVLYTCVTVLMYYSVCTSWKKGSIVEKRLFTCLSLCTVPFLYQFERSNIIFLALIFTMIFMNWRNSESIWKREMAYLSLAFAAGIKIYPAIFGLVMLKEKKYKDAVKLIVYGVIVFFLPFLFYGGIKDNFIVLLRNLSTTSAEFSMTRIGCQLDYRTMICDLLSFTGSFSRYMGDVVTTFIILAGCMVLLVNTEMWKTILLMTCMLIGVPAISYTYSAIFMIIPIIFFLDSGEKSLLDLVYLAGMLLVIIPLPFCWMEGFGDKYYSYMNISTPTRVAGLSIVLLTILLIIDGINKILKGSQYKILWVGIVICLVFMPCFIYREKLQLPYAYTDYLPRTLNDKMVLEKNDVIEQTFTASGSRLNSIILKVKAKKSEGVLKVTVKSATSGEVIKSKQVQLKNIERRYQEISFDDCFIKSGERYNIEVSVDINKDNKIYLWRTVETYEPEGEIFIYNGEQLKGALGIQINEKKK